MIGKLRFKMGGQQVTAVLEEGPKWTCGEPRIEAYLNQICLPQGASDVHLLYQTAERLGAEVVVAARQRETCAG